MLSLHLRLKSSRFVETLTRDIGMRTPSLLMNSSMDATLIPFQLLKMYRLIFIQSSITFMMTKDIELNLT